MINVYRTWSTAFHTMINSWDKFIYLTWVTRSERPKGAKDEVKQARRAKSRPEGPPTTWSTVVIHDQQAFMAMINVYRTWSTVFHTNDQQLWWMINSLSWQWSMFILHDQQSFIQWSMLIMHELLWMILFIKPWTMQTVSIHSLSLFCSVARRPPASEEGGMVASDHDNFHSDIIL